MPLPLSEPHRCGTWSILGRSMAAIAALIVAGCASAPRLAAPPERLPSAIPIGFGPEIRFSFDSVESFRQDSERTAARLKAAAPDGHINILALSGGGSGGAFGAGALTGWTRRGDRPSFQLVTGVSVGSLIAPFALLGSAWDPELTKAFSGEGSRGLLQRDLLNGLLGGSSLYRGEPLLQLIHRFATDELIAAIAREYRLGRMLFIETTDLDKGEPVIWNMGAIAEHGGPQARALFCQVLAASASIPTVFPPVLIRVAENGIRYDEMHVDGGTAVPVFVAPEIGPLVTEGAPHLAGANLYVLVNGKLGHFPTTNRNRTLAILSSAFDTTLSHNIRAQLTAAFTVARNYGMSLEVTAIPAGFPFTGSLDFDPDRMHRLFEYASKCAESGALWKRLDRLYHDAMVAPIPDPGATPACPVAQAAAQVPEASGAAPAALPASGH